MSELWQMSASEVARLVRTPQVSAREVANAAPQRLDSVNPRINAIVECRPDVVRKQADQVDSVSVGFAVSVASDPCAGFADTDGLYGACGSDSGGRANRCKPLSRGSVSARW